MCFMWVGAAPHKKGGRPFGGGGRLVGGWGVGYLTSTFLMVLSVTVM